MSWLSFALLATLAKSIQNFAEKSGQQKFGTLMITFLIMAISTVFIAPFVLLTGPIPSFNFSFFFGIIFSVLFYIIAKPLRIFALGTGDISQIIPLISFKSIFTLLIAWITLGEIPSLWGCLGVFLIAFGGFLINYKQGSKIFKNRSQNYLFISLIIASIMSVLDKLAIKGTSPTSPHYVLLAENLLSIPFFLYFLIHKKISFSPLKSLKNWGIPVLIALLYSIRNLLNFSAIGKGPVAYVVAISQLSSIIAVVGGVVFLKETGIKRKLSSAILMSIGAFLIGYLG
ncbi:EamA family transporter [Patescibacteria group bacterium]|nr:EamA family transporter [Patescibacteria group bacterium]